MTFAEALALSRRWYAVGLAGGARQAGTNAHNAADRRGSPWAAASEGLGLYHKWALDQSAARRAMP